MSEAPAGVGTDFTVGVQVELKQRKPDCIHPFF